MSYLLCSYGNLGLKPCLCFIRSFTCAQVFSPFAKPPPSDFASPILPSTRPSRNDQHQNQQQIHIATTTVMSTKIALGALPQFQNWIMMRRALTLGKRITLININTQRPGLNTGVHDFPLYTGWKFRTFFWRTHICMFWLGHISGLQTSAEGKQKLCLKPINTSENRFAPIWCYCYVFVGI